MLIMRLPVFKLPDCKERARSFFRQDKGTKLVRRLVENLLVLETTLIEFHCRRLSLVHVFWDHSLPLNSYSRP